MYAHLGIKLNTGLLFRMKQILVYGYIIEDEPAFLKKIREHCHREETFSAYKVFQITRKKKEPKSLDAEEEEGEEEENEVKPEILKKRLIEE